MKGFCPSCEKETDLISICKVENFDIKGEAIPAEVELLKCLECGEEFDDPHAPADPLPSVYREYRKRKDMVQPEQIREFRERFGLTQKDLSDLLGIGVATLSRYENGSLQDQTHDNLLKLIMEPHNLLRFVREKPLALSKEKRTRLLRLLEKELSHFTLLSLLIQNEQGGVSIENGYREFNLNKLLNEVKFLCLKSRIYKTKLNKLLFYADFKHYKENAVSITGLRYAHLPFGPVPDQYELIYEIMLQEDGTIRKEEDLNQDYPGEYFVCDSSPDLTVFTSSELKILGEVKHYFEDFTAKKIVEFSHAEVGYAETENGDLIPYSYADQLKI